MSAPVRKDRVLGDFILGRQIGEGGFGAVYEAQQRGLERAAVIKLIRSSLSSNREAVDRFVREAKLASRFDHPYAAHIYAFGAEPDGLLWIAMERVRGTPLNELITRAGPYAIDRFVPFMERLCEVVQAAHDQGIIHRDIKPSNVMVITRSGRLIPKLLDFGIAKHVTDTEPTVRPPRAPTPVPAQDLGRTLPELDETAAAFDAASGLTEAGQILGSPIYMAPEQWLDASRVGPWTDQYALAMLAFEALTGKRPYSGTTLTALLEAHTNEPLPAMPGIPDAVHAVLARATAKDPDARFPNLNMLASAFRTAVAPPSEQEERVELPAQQLATWIGAAPRPIAGALAALSAARSPVRVDDRATAAANVIARWIGVLALACRSQLGKLDSTSGVELIRELRRRPLREDEWLELAFQLTRPFVGRPEAWPIPELVTFLAGAPGFAALRALVRGEVSLSTGKSVNTNEHQAAVAKVERLASALDGLQWLLGYTVAREVTAGLELWGGVTADTAIVRPTYPAPEARGRIILLDADDTRVLALSPLVHVAPPAAGEPDQMFLLAGPASGGDAARYVAAPRGFELEVEGMWRWLADNVIDLSAQAAQGPDDERSPYPGLSAFTTQDHGSFVGREREVVEVVNRLRTQSTVVVVGPSGVGKSSFLGAGISCGLPAGWSARILRPGHKPLEALCSMLDLGDHADAAMIAVRLVTMAERTGQTVVIVVDQAEELFTVCRDEDQRVRFAEALAIAARAPSLRLILGIRDDFLCRLEDLAPWRGTLARSLQILRVPGIDELERIVTVPARRRGYDFDDPELPRAIAREVADQPGTLPLLAFAAAQLWDQRDRHFKRMTNSAYLRIGGVSGALVQYADAVVDRLSSSDRRLVRLAFRRLLTSDGTRAIIGRDELIASLQDPSADKVVEHLLAARLIVSRDADAGERVEIIHEALITMWPRLATWRREDDASTRVHHQLATAARSWDERGRPAGQLWRDDALDELRHWRAHAELGLTAVEAAFADASVRTWRSARWRRRGIVIAAFALLVVGLVVLANQRSRAVSRLAANLEERGRLAIRDDDALRGLVYLTEARRLGTSNPASDLLIEHAVKSMASQSGVLAHHPSAYRNAKVDDRTAVFMYGEASPEAATSGAQSWDLVTNSPTSPPMPGVWLMAPAGDRLVMIDSHGDVVVTGRDGTPRWRKHVGLPTAWVGGIWPSTDVAASAAGGVAVDYGPEARLWDLSDGRLRGTLVHDDAAIMVAAFDPDGRRVVTADSVGGVRIWDATTAAPIATCTGQSHSIETARFSADGTLVVTGAADGNVTVCDAATGKLMRRFDGTSRVAAVDIAKDGRTVAAVGAGGSARLWDVTTGDLLATLDGQVAMVMAVQFSPDGKLVATAGFDATVRIWDLAGTPIASLQSGAAATQSVVWEPDGRAVLTAGNDGTIRRWDVERARRGLTSAPHAFPITDLATTPDGRWWLAAARDGVVVGEIATGTPRSRPFGARVKMVSVAPDGQRLLVLEQLTDDPYAGFGSLVVRAVSDGAETARLPRTDIAAAAFTPDGRSIVTAGSDRVVRIWTADGVELASFPVSFQPSGFSFEPAGKFVIPTPDTEDPSVVDLPVIDLGTRTVARRLHNDDSAAPHAVAVDATGLAIDDGTTIRLWSGDDAAPRVLAEHTALILRLAFLPDGRLVSAGEDRQTFVWSRDGRLLSALPTGGSTVRAIAAARDGSIFATSGSDGVVRIWDAATYQPLLVLRSHHGPATRLRFGPDGDYLLSAGDDGRVVRWDLSRPTRSLDELERLVRCRDPYRLDGNEAIPHKLASDDPSCLEPGLGK